ERALRLGAGDSAVESDPLLRVLAGEALLSGRRGDRERVVSCALVGLAVALRPLPLESERAHSGHAVAPDGSETRRDASFGAAEVLIRRVEETDPALRRDSGREMHRSVEGADRSRTCCMGRSDRPEYTDRYDAQMANEP